MAVEEITQSVCLLPKAGVRLGLRMQSTIRPREVCTARYFGSFPLEAHLLLSRLHQHSGGVRVEAMLRYGKGRQNIAG